MTPKPDEKNELDDNQNNPEILSENFKQILKSNGIKDPVSEVIVNDAGLKGEGFLSITQYVTVKFEDVSKKPLNLFVKVQTENPSHIDMVNEIKAFEKEARFLTEYCRAAREMCESKGRPDFPDFYPKCYYGDGKMIVLENLVLDKGYSLINKEERQDLECARVAIQTLAKHHALGHVMISENGGPENFFRRFPDLDFECLDKPPWLPVMESSFIKCINSNIKILQQNDVVGAKETIRTLEEYSKNKPINMFLDAMKASEKEKDSFRLLCHGDYWNNNMMFLVDNSTKKILHQVVVDFQVTRYNSPSLDLGNYFFISVQPNVRRNHLLELLTLYKDTLNMVTEDFGHPTNLTLDQIFNDYRKKVGYGFWFGFMMTVGPGISLLKDMDITQMKIEDWSIIVDRLVNKWIDENPEKLKETAEELVKLVKEYEQLKV